MVLLDSHPDEQGRQERKNISLQKGDQYLDHIHEHHEANRHRCDPKRAENKYQRYKAQCYNVARCHVCEQTYHQRDRL